jgi:internalin A
MIRSLFRSLSAFAALSVLLSAFLIPTAGALEITSNTPITPIDTDTIQIVSPNTTVKMTDYNLRGRIAETLGKQSEDTFTYKEITDYCTSRGEIQLGASDRNITSLSGIEALASCGGDISLYLDNNKITDLSPLAKLKHLKKLYVSNNRITDIRGLLGLKELSELDLSSNQLTSLQGVEQSIGLTLIHLDNTGITDLSLLSPLLNLKVLIANDNNITDIRPLQGMAALFQVALSGNPVTDARPLAGMQHLQYLSLRNTRIADLNQLSNIPLLTSLDISGTGISNLAPIVGYPRLDTLRASGNAITSLAPLQGMTYMATLDVSGNGVSTLEPIAGLKSLILLNVSKNKIADLTPLSGLENLGALDISNNRIQSIKPLSKLSSLTKLYASDNWITDLEPLKYVVTKMTYAGLERNAIDLQTTVNKEIIDFLVAYKAEVHVDGQNVNKGAPPTDTPANPNTDLPFNDIGSHWAKDDIVWAYSNGIVGGVAPGVFNPNAVTTEAQFLKMLLIAMKGIAEQPVSSPWSQKYYDLAAANNYPVHPDKRDQPITRTTVAELIAGTQGVNASGDAAIQYLLDNKLTQGKTSATVEGYKGGDSLTRAESVRFIRNVLQNAKFTTPQKRP